MKNPAQALINEIESKTSGGSITLSPISRAKNCSFRPVNESLEFHESFGVWASYKTLFKATGFDGTEAFKDGDFQLSLEETDAACALFKTRVFQAKYRDRPVQYLMLEAELKKIEDNPDTRDFNINGIDPAMPISMERLHRDAQRLTIETKALLTLPNIAMAERMPGDGIELPFNLIYPGSFNARDLNTYCYDGFAYACTQADTLVVMEYLRLKNLILINQFEQSRCKVHLTPEGYIQADLLNKRVYGGLRKCFLIGEFGEHFSTMYNEVYKPMGDDLGYPIYPVDKHEHIGRIDDRIIREIQESKIIIVDLTSYKNYNVGFESGYAMALGKPIVFTISESKVKAKAKSKSNTRPRPLKLPFDVQSYNTLVYNPSNLDDFRERFTYRLRAAIDIAEAGNPYIPEDFFKKK